MDPFYIVKTLWSHKLIAIPLVMLVIAASGYAFFFGPRSYESSSAYVLLTPGLPTEGEILTNPSLAGKSDNPYLRSVDPSLAAQVVTARLGSQEVAQKLQDEGLSTEYAVLPASEFGSGQILRVSASANEPEKAVATTIRLGELLSEELRSIQDIKGADDRYMMTAQAINPPGVPIERMSSRLRSVIMVGIGGVVLVFGAISLVQAMESRRAAGRGGAESIGDSPALKASEAVAPSTETASSTLKSAAVTSSLARSFPAV